MILKRNNNKLRQRKSLKQKVKLFAIERAVADFLQ